MHITPAKINQEYGINWLVFCPALQSFIIGTLINKHTRGHH